MKNVEKDDVVEAVAKVIAYQVDRNIALDGNNEPILYNAEGIAQAAIAALVDMGWKMEGEKKWCGMNLRTPNPNPNQKVRCRMTTESERAFEEWYDAFPVGGRAAKEGLAWTTWQACERRIKDKLLSDETVEEVVNAMQKVLGSYQPNVAKAALQSIVGELTK